MSRSKFRCDAVAKSGEGENATYSVSLSAVPSSGKENNSLLLSEVNATDGEQFHVGSDYFIEITTVDDPISKGEKNDTR